MLAELLLFNAFLGALVVFVVLRADWRRRENLLLGVACLFDDLLLLGVGLFVLSGAEIARGPAFHYALICRILVVHPLLEFAYAFPAARTPPAWLRWLGVSATALTLALALTPATAAWVDTYSVLFFFSPYFVVTLSALAGNLRRLERTRDATGVRLIIAAMAARWTTEVTLLLLVRPFWPDALTALFTFDVTVLAFALKVIIAYVVLRHGFFRVRGLIAEAVLWHVLGLAALGTIVVLVELVLRHVSQPLLQRGALVGVSLLPLPMYLLLRSARPQLETAVLPRLDPRRVVLRGVLERVLQQTATLVEAKPICALTTSAVEELCGRRVEFLRCPETGVNAISLGEASDPELGTALAKHLEHCTQPQLNRGDFRQVSVEVAAELDAHGVALLVPVRFGSKLLGALALHGGEIDRDSIDTTVALAGNLGSKLAHAALYQHAFRLQQKIEKQRHLATLGSFAAAMAHDIRTPLTSVQLNLQLIRSDANLSTDQVESVDIALAELKRMAGYVSEVLDYSKPVRLQPVELEVGPLIGEAARTLQPLFGLRRVQLDVNAGGAGPLPAVRADADRLRQVLVNLLENAAEASQPGDTIQLQVRPLGSDRLAIDVTDQGRGISSADLDRIFEPFFTTRTDGTGLGLAIAKKLVLAHAGQISVSSTPETGSTFTVVLPAHVVLPMVT